MNVVKLSGHLGADPEAKHLPNGTMLTNANLATSNDYKKKGDKEWTKRDPSWHRLVAFGEAAKTLADYRKGKKIEIEGKLIYNNWTDKDGIKRTSAQVQVWRIVTKEDKDREPGDEQDRDTPPPPVSDDDVPF